jgi:hypothetical protein
MFSGQSLEILKTENIAYGFAVNFWGEDSDPVFSSILVNAFLMPPRGKKFVHARKPTPEKQCFIMLQWCSIVSSSRPEGHGFDSPIKCQ